MLKTAASTIKPDRERRTLSGEGAERGRSTGNTNDSGPMKPGNSVEDKTLTTGKQKTEKAPWTKNPTLAAVNTNLEPRSGGDFGKSRVIQTTPSEWREVVDERRG